jgi:hypothetical protein
MILPLALAQFIASYAATNMNVAITPIATEDHLARPQITDPAPSRGST